MKSKSTIIILISIFLIVFNKPNNEPKWEVFLEDGVIKYSFIKNGVSKTENELYTSVHINYGKNKKLIANKKTVAYRSLSETVIFDCEKQMYLAPDIFYYNSSG